ncbi:MAG: hypothetical protein K0R38_1291 [Polyangiaceae bacterium]|jgi:hypothetical protein|nr:hypothetical protein [Polyangiaceae bacterium]
MDARKPDRTTEALLALALIVPWLFIWQGLDFTDQGYLLTTYRCFLRYPETTPDAGTFWLTSFVGAVWDWVWGRFGVVGMRALWATCSSVGLLLSFRLVARVSSERAASLALVAASVFLSDRRETWFSYNTSSSVLFVGTATCLVGGIALQRRSLLLATGALIGVLPFARIPNVLAVALLAAPVLGALLEAPRRKRLVGDLAVMLGGVALGVAGMLSLIHALGHSPLFFQAIKDLFAPGMEDAGYGTDKLIVSFFRDNARALAWGLGTCAAGTVLARALAVLPKRVGWLLIAVVSALGGYGLSGTDELWSVVVPGTAYWLLGGVVLGLGRGSSELRAHAFVALVVLVIAPLGSNNGILNAHVGLWLALPLVLSVIGSVHAKWLVGQGPKLAVIAGLVLGGEGLHRAATYTYRDAPRIELVARVRDRQLRAQLTTPARAKVVTEVLQALKQRVAPGDYLLAYEGTPLLQYLTRTRPYLNRAWLMGAAESATEIKRIAAAAPRRTGCLPVVVSTRQSTRGAGWPQNPRGLEKRTVQRRVRKVIGAFLREHDYKRTWSNDFFEILEPPARRSGACR